MRKALKHLMWSGLIWGIFMTAGFFFLFSGQIRKTALTMEGEEIRWGKESNREKIAYLTFDDGPSNHTNRLLDLLKEEEVRATFFVVGKEGEEAEEIYKRIVREGHGLGLHSYSHVYSDIYSSEEKFEKDLWKLKTYLYHVTGVSSDIYRFPGGSGNSSARISKENCVAFLREKNMEYYDWNASAEDAICVGTAPDVLMKRVLKDALKYDKTIILMHDLNSCETTLNMVRPLILRLKKEGYSFEILTKETEPIGRQFSGD